MAPSERNADIIGVFTALGVVNVFDHFRLSRRHRHGITWRQIREDQVVAARCDVILADSTKRFTNAQLRTARGYDSDHEVLCAWFKTGSLSRQRGYLNARKSIPPMSIQDPTVSDTLFEALVQRVSRPTRTARERKPWISEDTWLLVDQRAQARRQSTLSDEALTALNRQIQRSLRKDRKQHAIAAGAAIEAALDGDNLQEAWNLAKGWYRQASNYVPKPSRQDFIDVCEERTALYRATPPPGAGIPLHVDPYDVLDEIPDEGEIADACQSLRLGRASGASGIKPEHLRKWLRDYHHPDGDSAPWQTVVELVQRAFSHGDLPQALSRSILVVIPKPQGGNRGLGLLETLLKLIEKIIDVRLTSAITFHPGLHGFRKKRGCGTAILECKLEQEKAIFQGHTLFQAFVDLTKAYDTLDRDRTLEILTGYGVGSNVTRILRRFGTG